MTTLSFSLGCVGMYGLTQSLYQLEERRMSTQQQENKCFYFYLDSANMCYMKDTHFIMFDTLCMGQVGVNSSLRTAHVFRLYCVGM